MTHLTSLILGIIIGMCLIWLASKYYCFNNPKEWNKFKKEYSKKWQSQQ